MPASVYRMAGKPHFTESTPAVTDPSQSAEEAVVAQDSVVTVAPVEQTVSSQIADELVNVAPSQDPIVLSTPATEPVLTSPSYPTWDPSWTKTKLLEVATSLNLPVTVDNTKAQIIAALTTATSA